MAMRQICYCLRCYCSSERSTTSASTSWSSFHKTPLPIVPCASSKDDDTFERSVRSTALACTNRMHSTPQAALRCPSDLPNGKAQPIWVCPWQQLLM